MSNRGINENEALECQIEQYVLKLTDQIYEFHSNLRFCETPIELIKSINHKRVVTVRHHFEAASYEKFSLQH